jgi:hypothetical protein
MRHFGHREWQEQGAVLHALRGERRHRQGHRDLAAEHQGIHERLRPDLRLGFAAAQVAAEAGKHITLEGTGEGRDHRGRADAVPEPMALLLFGVGLLMIGVMRRA